MIIKYPKRTNKGDEILIKEKSEKVNPFDSCHLWDAFLEDLEEIKEFLKSLKVIYDELPEIEREREIYLNFRYGEKYVFASYEKIYLMVLTPINDFLTFKNDKELTLCSQLLMALHANLEEYDSREK